jgi:hypothetical protein
MSPFESFPHTFDAASDMNGCLAIPADLQYQRCVELRFPQKLGARTGTSGTERFG